MVGVELTPTGAAAVVGEPLVDILALVALVVTGDDAAEVVVGPAPVVWATDDVLMEVVNEADKLGAVRWLASAAASFSILSKNNNNNNNNNNNRAECQPLYSLLFDTGISLQTIQNIHFFVCEIKQHQQNVSGEHQRSVSKPYTGIVYLDAVRCSNFS